jgi:hypothetical protein
MTERIEKLCKAIENEQNCNAKHAGSVGDGYSVRGRGFIVWFDGEAPLA